MLMTTHVFFFFCLNVNFSSYACMLKSSVGGLMCDFSTFIFKMMDPNQDLLLAALSECGISPNDLFDGDSLDIGLLAPSQAPVTQQVSFEETA